MKILILDFETFSTVDLKEVGAYEYSIHPTTRVECIGFKFGLLQHLLTLEPKLVLPEVASGNRAALKAALADPTVQVVAHNALFDFLICNNTMKVKVPLDRWHCTAAQAASAGLPRSLDGATSALGTIRRKDKTGGAIMKRLAHTESDELDNYMQLYQYCLSDIEATTELFLSTPKLVRSERIFWLTDQLVNLRGFTVDRQLIDACMRHIEFEVNRLDSTIHELTGGALKSTRQIGEVKKYLAKIGVRIPNMQAETVDAFLESPDLPAHAKAILENRHSSKRTSTGKYEALELRSRSDGRVRDTLVYYGAHTGRQAGVGPQPQNLFKSVISQQEVDQGIAFLQMPGSVGYMHYIFDNPMEVLASVMRSCIVAAEGKKLVVGDFSTIEVCVLFWMAEHHEGVKALREGSPIYLEMAAAIYKEPLQQLVQLYAAGDEPTRKKRQLGKATVLGSGFGIGLGGERFQVAAKTLGGLTISQDTAKLCVRTYRNKNPQVVQYWDEIEDAARAALLNPGVPYRMKRGLIWKKINNWLTVQLPSGRKLWYYGAALMQGKYGPVITYMATDAKSKKYIRTKTWGGKLTENVVQAVARDLLYEALHRLEHDYDYECVLTIHDEIVCEVTDNDLDAARINFESIMARTPDWGKDIPIKVEAWEGYRYKK